MAEQTDLFESTPFEWKIRNDQRWKWVWDDGNRVLAGYVKHSSGYTEMRDRNGNVVYANEISIVPSLISPLDLLGGGSLGRVFGKLLGRGIVRLSGVIAKASARRAVMKALNAELKVGLRSSCKGLRFRYSLIDAISREFPSYRSTIVGLCKHLNDGKLWSIAKSLGVDLAKILKP